MTTIRSFFQYNIPLILLTTFLFISCEKEPSKLGRNILETENKVIVIKDTCITIFPVKVDSVNSANLSANLLGVFNDPVFGYSRAEVMFQVVPTTFSDNLPEGSITVDSITFSIKVDSVYGIGADPQVFAIYPLNSSILNKTNSSLDPASYYLSADKSGELAFQAITSDTTMRFTLDKDILSRYLLVNSGFDSLTYSSYADFINYFQGFYLKTSDITTEGGILHLDLFDTATVLRVHFNDSMTLGFRINVNCWRLNVFTHDYSNAAILLNDSSNAMLTKKSYIQSMGGIHSAITFKNPGNWDVTDMLAKAELIIPVHLDGQYGLPKRLGIAPIDETGSFEELPDHPVNMGTTVYLDGELQDSQYVFNITRHIQEVMDGAENKTLYLFPVEYSTDLNMRYNAATATRAVVKTANMQDGLRMILTFTYLE